MPFVFSRSERPVSTMCLSGIRSTWCVLDTLNHVQQHLSTIYFHWLCNTSIHASYDILRTEVVRERSHPPLPIHPLYFFLVLACSSAISNKIFFFFYHIAASSSNDYKSGKGRESQPISRSFLSPFVRTSCMCLASDDTHLDAASSSSLAPAPGIPGPLPWRSELIQRVQGWP